MEAGEEIKYVGITTSRSEQYEEMLNLMRRETLDFIQVDYSIGNRAAAERVLPLAAERGIAVLVNLPFGGRRQASWPASANDHCRRGRRSSRPGASRSCS